MKSFFKSEQGKQEVLHLYYEKLHDLQISYDSLNVETSFGQTHVIATGSESNPPLIVVHGSNACAPIALETYPSLSAHFRVYAVDVLSQPNKSAATRLSMKDDSYGRWMNEVIRELGLTEVTLVGFSFGGLVILKTLEYDESKVKQVYMAAPAYIVNGNPIRALFKVFLPMKRFIKTKDVNYVENFLAEVFTDRDEFAIRYLEKVFLHFEMDFTPVPTITKAAARKMNTPITLYAAKDDIMFPGRRMVCRAKRIFPSLKRVELLEDSKHVQSDADNRSIEQTIIKDLG